MGLLEAQAALAEAGIAVARCDNDEVGCASIVREVAALGLPVLAVNAETALNAF